MMADNNAVNADGKVKSKVQLKKEAKRNEKMAKFEAKKLTLQATMKKENVTEKDKKKKQHEEAQYGWHTTIGDRKDTICALPDAYSIAYVEAAWYEWWEKEGFFMPEYGRKEREPVDSTNTFTMVIPPPNVTGSLHLGHALTNSVEDAITRWHRMHGRQTLWNPGCDHAGIATQVVVEKKLMRDRGLSRHELGREKFIQEVWKWKEEKGDRIYAQLRKLGSSCDWSRARFTLDETMCRAVTEAFVQLHDRGLIYRAQRLVNWSCTLMSAISEIEVDKKELAGRTFLPVPGYTEKVEFGMLTSFAYPLEDSDAEIVVATTRVETMLGDTAVAVHPEDDRYKHLIGHFVCHPLLDRRLPVVGDTFVDRSFGTGAVKITPAHDHNDFDVGMRHNLPFVTCIDEKGMIAEGCGEFTGMKRFDARKAVLEALTSRGLFRGTVDNPMVVPICSRSKDIIEPLVKPQWYVRCQGMADKAMAAVEKNELKIIPDVHKKTWFAWLTECRDWCISRQLWWGHLIPAYHVAIKGRPPMDSGEDSSWVVGRTKEDALATAAEKFGVPACDITLEQDPDVLDTWFSSQLFPFAIFGWPEKTMDLQSFYPGALLETGHDILFFWVARMVMIGLELMGDLPFKEVYLHAMVRDSHGRKMSKSLGNMIDPIDVINGITLEELQRTLESGNLDRRELEMARSAQSKDFPQGIPRCGTDALRFALCAYTAQGRDINLDVLRVYGYRQFCNKIWQATKFVLRFALTLDNGTQYTPPPSTADLNKVTGLNRWILSRLTDAVTNCNAGFVDYDFPRATTAVYNFWLYDLCDVYLEYSKPILKDNARSDEANTVRHAMYTCLDVGLRLIHPFMPFVSEELFQRLPRRTSPAPPSICVTPYPKDQEFPWREEKLEDEVKFVLTVLHGVRSMRTDHRVTPKQEVEVRLMAGDACTRRLFEPSSYAWQVVKSLGTCSKLTVEEKSVDDGGVPVGCAVCTVSADCAVLLRLPNYDPQRELARLEPQLEQLGKDLTKLKTEVARSDYELKVPLNIRENNAAKMKEFESKMTTLREAITNLRQQVHSGGGDSTKGLERWSSELIQLVAEWTGTRANTNSLRDPVAMAMQLASTELKGGTESGRRYQVLQWCNWSALSLAPLTAESNNQRNRQSLSTCFFRLNKWLTTRTYLAGERVTLADLTVWSVVRKVLAANSGELTHLRRWAKTIASQPKVLKVYPSS